MHGLPRRYSGYARRLLAMTGAVVRRQGLRNRKTGGMTTLFSCPFPLFPRATNHPLPPFSPVAKRGRAWPESGRRLSDRARHRLFPRCSIAPDANRWLLHAAGKHYEAGGGSFDGTTLARPAHASTDQAPSPDPIRTRASRPGSFQPAPTPKAPSPLRAHHTHQPAPTASARRTRSRRA
jgi:hypothetical protein